MTIRHDELLRYRKALSAARGALAVAAAALDAMPAYIRQATSGAGIVRDPRLEQDITRAATLRRDALAHRAAIEALERDLDEFDRFAQPAEHQRAMDAARAWLDTVKAPTQLLAELKPDPRRAYEGRPMSTHIARAILAARDTLGRPTANLGNVVTVAHALPADLEDLVHTGKMRCDAVGRDVAVGVLLPLRIETRFRAPEVGRPQWQLRVRVFPESAAIDRRGGPARANEIDALRRFWRDIDGDLRHPNAASAFHILSDALGPPRAAWLARSVPVRRTDVGGAIDVDPVVVGPPDYRSFQKAVGLPDQLEVWAARAGNPPSLLATMLPIDRAALGAQADLHARFTDPAVSGDDVSLPETWWLSYDEAKKVGLGVDIDVGVVAPNDIDALYVIGVGRDSATQLFEAHAAAGELAVLAPGTPTNTVEGEPTTDLGRDPARWLATARRTGLDQPAVALLERALTGGRARLGALHGGDVDLVAPARSMVGSLWPALWNRDAKDFWGAGAAAWDAGRWAARFLAPEGPYPAIRIGDQPYGVLPATSLARWVAHASDLPVETALRDWAGKFRANAAAAAEHEGNVVDATAERLLELLTHTPVTSRPGWRYRLPLDLERRLLLLSGTTVTLTALEQAWDTRAAQLRGAGLDPVDRLTPHGPVRPWSRTLLEGDPRKAVDEILHAPAEKLAYTPDLRWRVQPMPLLARLLRHALILTNAELYRVVDALANGILATLNPHLLIPIDDAYRLPQLATHEISNVDMANVEASGNGLALTVQDAWFATRDAGRDLLNHEPDRLDALLRATLDAASHRVDPWLTGIADRRLRWLAGRDAKFRLGAYGWVDSPKPYTGPPDGASPLRPGPTDAGVLHAPSAEQALVAALLRDRAVRDPADDGFDIALTSASIRTALHLIEQVRLGVHVKEALGLEVERIAGDPASVLALRAAYPMRPEHAGRQVCDGERVLADALSAAPPALVAPLAPQLAPLQRVLDTYGDLLVVDAVHALVSGRGDLAAPAMEAAAGLGPPPDMRALKTRRSGTAAATIVLAAIPDAAAPPGAGPAQLADPAFAARVAAELGVAATWTWRFREGRNPPVNVTLADAHLAGVDTVSLTDGAIATALRNAARATLAATLASTGGQERVDAARRLAAMLAGNDALPDLRDDPDPRPDINLEAAASLRTRLITLISAAGGLRARLGGAPTATDIADAVRWGLVADPVAAVAALTERIAAATKAATGDTAALRRALRHLSGHAALPVLPAVAIGATAALPHGLAPIADVDGRPAIDRSWLELVAAVRTPLARIEAHQVSRELDGASAWRAWSTNPADPWRPAGSDASLIVLYGPADVIAWRSRHWIVMRRPSRAASMRRPRRSGSMDRNRARRRRCCLPCRPTSLRHSTWRPCLPSWPRHAAWRAHGRRHQRRSPRSTSHCRRRCCSRPDRRPSTTR